MTTQTTTTSLEPTAAQRRVMNDAFKMGLSLGRKFAVDDITIEDSVLYQAAMAFAQLYTGDFEYMVDMSNAARQGFLTMGQAKGVLNCLMAEARRRMNTKAQAAVTFTNYRTGRDEQVAVQPAAPVLDFTGIMDGYYTVVFDASNPSERLTLRIDAWEGFTDKRTGQPRDDVRSVKYLAGPDNESDYMFAAAITANSVLFTSRNFGPRVQQALEILRQASGTERAAMGAAYAFQSRRCWRCHRELTVEDSVAGGIGPVCAKKIGVAYGGEAIEAAKEAMARLQAGNQPAAAAQPAPVAPEPRPDDAAVFDSTGAVINARRYREIFGEDAA